MINTLLELTELSAHCLIYMRSVLTLAARVVEEGGGGGIVGGGGRGAGDHCSCRRRSNIDPLIVSWTFWWRGALVQGRKLLNADPIDGSGVMS